MEAEYRPGTIEQWYNRATALDWNWRESRREEERLKGRRELEGTAPRQQEQRQIMPQPLVWQRRQEMPPQQVTTGPAPMEEVKRTNAVMMWPQQRIGLAQCNLYAMEIDRVRNCYTCRGFGHMACHCRNQGQRGRMEEGRRVEYGEEIEGNYGYSNNLKEVENLESLNWILIINSMY